MGYLIWIGILLLNSPFLFVESALEATCPNDYDDHHYAHYYDEEACDHDHDCLDENGENKCDESKEVCCYDHDAGEHLCKDQDYYYGCIFDSEQCADQGKMCCFDDHTCTHVCKLPAYQISVCPEYFTIGANEKLKNCSDDDVSNCHFLEMCCQSPFSDQKICAYSEVRRVICPVVDESQCQAGTSSKNCSSDADCVEKTQLCCYGSGSSKCCQDPVIESIDYGLYDYYYESTTSSEE